MVVTSIKYYAREIYLDVVISAKIIMCICFLLIIFYNPLKSSNYHYKVVSDTAEIGVIPHERVEEVLG